MNRGKILRGMLLSGDSRHSEGLYQFDSWSVRLGPDARSPEARMTSLHEAYHGFLNDSTAYGTVMHGVSALRHELPDHDHDAVLVALLERCVDAHETYAVYASLFLVGRGYPDPALLVHYPDYASLLVDTDAATSRLTNPVLRFQLVQSLIRAAMQVDCLPAFISTPTSGWQALAAEIEAPNERLELLLRPSSLATIEEQFRAWSEQQSEPSLREVLDATDVDDYDALTDERLDPATDAIGHFFYQASRSLLHVHCRNCLEFNGHQAHTRAFLHVIDEQLPVELRGTILAPAREGSILEDLVIDFADEQLVISPEPYSARWYRLDDLPEDRWADLAVGTPPHVFIAIRPLSRIRDQYKFEQEILHDVVDDEVVVSVRRMVVNDGPMFIEHVVVSSPERLERLTERLGQLGPVVISCSMSLLTDTAWTNRWWRAIRSATFSSILMDMNPITQLRRWAEQGELETALAIIDSSDGRRTHVVATLTPATDEDLIFLTPCGPTISAALTFEVRRLRAAGQSVSEDRSHIDRANHPMALVLSHLLREEPWFDFHGG